MYGKSFPTIIFVLQCQKYVLAPQIKYMCMRVCGVNDGVATVLWFFFCNKRTHVYNFEPLYIYLILI